VAIGNAPRMAKRVPLYRDLLKVARKTLGYTNAAISRYQQQFSEDVLLEYSTYQELREYARLTAQVIEQTERRVLRGEKVHASEKIVSIFESHTDIIRKDRRETLYGHKLCLTAGASGLVLDCVIERGNPADSNLAVKMIERQIDIYGRAPKQSVFDGGFSSKQNLEDIKALKVEDVVFSKAPGIALTEMVKTTKLYRRLKHFRAGIESVISFLKRSFGWDRCTWRSFDSFQTYCWASVVSANLLTIARRLIQ
jgi:transposase, IS5 family